MKFSTDTIVLASLMASAALAEEAPQNLRKRQLQWGGFGDFLGGQEGPQNPLDDIMDNLIPGFENTFDISAIQAMDPLILGDEAQKFEVEDTLGITNCTGLINVTIVPGNLTGLSTLTMDRFALVQNSEQVESSNWWSGMIWSGTFDMLARADYLILEGGITIETDDAKCLQDVSSDGSFSMGVKVSMKNPVLDMKIDIGGSSPSFLNWGSSSVADSISTNDVSFTYDTWTIEIDSPQGNETIDVADMIQSFDSLWQDTFNTTDINDIILEQANNFMDGAAIVF